MKLDLGLLWKALTFFLTYWIIDIGMYDVLDDVTPLDYIIIYTIAIILTIVIAFFENPKYQLVAAIGYVLSFMLWHDLLLRSVVFILFLILCIRLASNNKGVWAYSLMFINAISYYNEIHLEKLMVFLTIAYMIVVPIGESLRHYKSSSIRLSNQLQQVNEEIEVLQRDIKEELAVTLHNSIAKDLTHISLLTQRLSSERTDPELVETINRINALSHEAMGSVRTLINTLDKDGKPVELSQIFEESAQLLEAKDIKLSTVIEDVDVKDLGDEQYDLLLLFIKESTLNALKYSPAHAVAKILLDIEEGLLVCNIISAYTDTDNQESTGGFGLANLQNRAKRLGGYMVSTIDNQEWINSLSLPVNSASHE